MEITHFRATELFQVRAETREEGKANHTKRQCVEDRHTRHCQGRAADSALTAVNILTFLTILFYEIMLSPWN
jgi:hypothetical protein